MPDIHEDGHMVVLGTPEALVPQEIGKGVSAWRKMPFQDSVRIARNSWGIVMSGLEEADAQALQKQLEAVKLPSFVLGPGLLAGLPETRPLKRIILSDTGFEIPVAKDDPGIHVFKDPNAPQGPVQVPWSRVRLIAAAGVTLTEYQKIKVKEGPTAGQKALNIGIMMATGLPIKVGTQERVVERTVESSELVFFLDVVLSEPAQRYRIDAQAFDYSCLGAKKAYNVLQNVKALVGEFVRLAPPAWKNKGTGIILNNKPVREMGYLSLEDLDKETRWLLTLIRRSTP